MNVALAQINVESGNCEGNFETIKTKVSEAKQQGADIVVFPEMCISGYLLQDKFLDVEFCEYVASFNDKVKALSDDIGIIFGNLYYETIDGIEVGRDGRKARYNAALFAFNNEWVKKENGLLDGVHIKHLNPDYRIFDDSRYFLSGIEVSNALYQTMDSLLSPFLFEKNEKQYRIGLEVCEDIWSFDYSVDVTGIYVSQKVDVIVNVSSSPYTPNKENSRHKQIKKHAHNCNGNLPPIVYVNACGMQNNGKNVVLFDGDSCAYDQDGNLCFSLNDSFQEELKVYDFRSISLAAPCKTKMLSALTTALYEFDRQVFPFHPKWIIGLSGGLDSTLSAALLVKALGADRVIGYNLASKYNSDNTKNIARILADKLNIELREGSIEAVDQATVDTMKAYGYADEYNSLVYENIQARLRGHLLSTFASIENGVIINNGNKVEVAIGYCTLYGDTIGAISPLGDLSKVQLFELAKEINEDFQKEIISKQLIPSIVDDQIEWDVPPTAELKDAQLDPMKWYYHDEIITRLMNYPTGQIESFMKDYLSDNVYEQEIGKWIRYYGLDDPKAFIEDLEWLLKKIHTSVFKRIQMPPIVLMSRGAFGGDFRESQIAFVQTEKYKELRKQILAK